MRYLYLPITDKTFSYQLENKSIIIYYYKGEQKIADSLEGTITNYILEEFLIGEDRNALK